MPKPHVDREICIGCSTCETVCPNVFLVEENVNDEKYKDEIKAYVKEADYQAEKELVDQAIEDCPVDCISWKE
jgi:ferredoxin